MWGKILAGAVVGVGTFAAGWFAGSAYAKEDAEKAKKKGQNEATAKYEKKLEELQNKLIHLNAKAKTQHEYFANIIALEAVAVSVAACDGYFSQKEKEEIGEFVRGMLDLDLPESVKKRIQKIYDKPPSFEQAFNLAGKSAIPMATYLNLIKFVTRIDGVKPEEKKFISKWEKRMSEIAAAA